MKILIKTGILIFLVVLFSSNVSASDLNHTYRDMNNSITNMEKFEGKPLLVDAFATWCEPCKIEIGHLKEIYNSGSDELNILSLSVSETSDTVNKVKTFRNDFDASWEFGIDHEGSFENSFKVVFIPSLYLFNSDGNLIKSWEGITSPSEVAKVLKDELGLDLDGINKNPLSGISDQLSGNTLFQMTSAFVMIAIVYLLVVPKEIPTMETAT